MLETQQRHKFTFRWHKFQKKCIIFKNRYAKTNNVKVRKGWVYQWNVYPLNTWTFMNRQLNILLMKVEKVTKLCWFWETEIVYLWTTISCYMENAQWSPECINRSTLTEVFWTINRNAVILVAYFVLFLRNVWNKICSTWPKDYCNVFIVGWMLTFNFWKIWWFLDGLSVEWSWLLADFFMAVNDFSALLSHETPH